MDPSLNDFDENIRPPDEVRREQLIEDNRTDFDKEIEKAIYLSIQDAREQEKTYQDFEKEIINNYFTIQNERKDKFREFLIDLNKLIKYDKDIKEIYEIIYPIIESYCDQFIEYVELDDITYDKIFKVIGTIRTNKKNIELLKIIIIKIS
jgi:hypothetical protein